MQIITITFSNITPVKIDPSYLIWLTKIKHGLSVPRQAHGQLVQNSTNNYHPDPFVAIIPTDQI
jgi:ligand-binding sensor domain-containing protein